MGSAQTREPVATGWKAIDQALGSASKPGGITRGAIHEWFGGEAETSFRRFPPPLAILIHLVRQGLEPPPLEMQPTIKAVVWIGRACWPYPPLLQRGAGPPLLRVSAFVDARDHGERVWALDVALRCPRVGVVVGDGSGLSMAESRRLQLAADAGGTLGLIARPLCERGEISAAQTRWIVRSEPSETGDPRWSVELLRCKGMRPSEEGARRAVVRWRHETGDVGVVSDALDRPAETERWPVRVRHAV